MDCLDLAHVAFPHTTFARSVSGPKVRTVSWNRVHSTVGVSRWSKTMNHVNSGLESGSGNEKHCF